MKSLPRVRRGSMDIFADFLELNSNVSISKIARNENYSTLLGMAVLFCIYNNSFLLSRKSIIQSDWYHGDSGQLVEHLGGGHQDDLPRADHCYVQVKASPSESSFQ